MGLLVFIVGKALSVAAPVGTMITGLSCFGSAELVNFFPRLFLGMPLFSAGTGVVVENLWCSSG